MKEGTDAYNSCRLCPRECGVDRRKNTGWCGCGTDLRIASAVLHRGEEPPVSGTRGSGAVFFSGCTLGCRFCQNTRISSGGMGRDVTHEEFVRLLLLLQERGAHNINLVTGTQFIPGITAALAEARCNGLSVPAVWNTSGFESIAGLDMLDGHIEVYLPDIKCVDREVSRRLFGSEAYASAILPAVHRMTRPPRYDNAGMLVQGTIIRHLVLPGLMENTREVLRVFAEEFAGTALLSLMVQYLPPGEAESCSCLPERMRRKDGAITEDEYEKLLLWLDEFGLEDGFIQDLSGPDDWLPDFYSHNPFPKEYSDVVFHWRQ